MIKNKGFTLIEVMVALAVFAIAGTALLSSAQSNFGHLARLEKQTIASWIASNQLVEVSLDKSWPPKNNKKGETEFAGHEWFWLQKVEKTLNDNMRAVTIEVRVNEADEQPMGSMTTYLTKKSATK
jgi:general secretion pathway protein I